MIFSPKNYRSLKDRLKKRYALRFSKLPKSSLKSFKLAKLSKAELRDYSPLNWFVLKQLDLLRFFETAELGETSEDGFSEIEDQVFESWNKSEFADVFLKQLNRGATLAKANQETLKAFDLHAVNLIERHILRTEGPLKHYRTQTSLGERTSKKKITKLLSTHLHLEGKDVVLYTPTLKEMKTFSSRIETALKVIRLKSPSSHERFLAFTEVIVPISQKEFVSYSHQELPGHSMINLYDRDFVDLMDDLLHENGHHHLNYYLNLGKLIEEPIDEIYYSPWRRTPRPLRGIYHAYFTFFWAFKLFSDLASEKEMDSIWYQFSDEQKEKILWRAVEEFWMLEYSFVDLKKAHKEGLIHQEGWKLIEAQRKELFKFKKKIPLWEKKLKTHKKELKELKRVLKDARAHFAFD